MPASFPLPAIVRRLIRRPAAPAELPNQLRPIADVEAGDVFLAAYPKSGVTWLQSLVAGVIYGLDPAQAPDRLVQDLVPDVHYKTHYKRYRTPTFFKTHHLPRPDYRRVVYLLRDGRDVMVSYAHHVAALEGRPVDVAALVADEALFPCPWHRHVEAWAANPFGARVLTIRYEDLKADAVRELERFCAFVDQPRDRLALERVARQCSLEAMRAKERRFGWDNPAWPKDRPFVRRGIAGSHRDEMPPEALARFLRDAGATLGRCGYVV
jgi:Sulfotransferase domain